MGKRGCVGESKRKSPQCISETWGKTVADICGERGLAREKKKKKRQNPAPWPKHMRQHGSACDKRREHGAWKMAGKYDEWRDRWGVWCKLKKYGAKDGECGESMGVCVTNGGKPHGGQKMGRENLTAHAREGVDDEIASALLGNVRREHWGRRVGCRRWDLGWG